jgi:hypothetical protein
VLRRIGIGSIIVALALGPAAGSAVATVRAFNIWASARAYPRLLHSTGNHRFTLEVLVENRRSSTARLFFSVSDDNLVFDGRRMVFRMSYGTVTVQPPAVGSVIRLAPPTDAPAYMCFSTDAGDSIGIDVTMPAHTKTTLRVELTAVVPYWLPNPVTPFTRHGLYTVFEPDLSWNSAFANVATEIPVAPVRLTGAPGEELFFNGPGEILDDAVGGVFPIGGTTDPPAPHRLVVLTARRWLGHSRWRTVPVALIRTDGLGYFNYNWVPRRPGYYQIVGRMPHPARGILPDGACGQIAHVIAR